MYLCDESMKRRPMSEKVHLDAYKMLRLADRRLLVTRLLTEEDHSLAVGRLPPSSHVFY